MLEERLANPAHWSNAERIREMRRIYFADVDALQASGGLELPK